MIEQFNTIVGIGIVLLQVFLLVTILAWIFKAPMLQTIGTNANRILRFVFTLAALGSLTYELVFGYSPCLLCWYQRMAIFPLAILLWTGDIRKSALLRAQTLLIGGAGFVFALFHNYIDLFPSSNLDICGTGPSCLLRYVYEFGYVTIPMMSATVLLVGIILTLLSKRYPQV